MPCSADRIDPGNGVDRAGERAAPVAEQLAFDEIARDGGAVERDERPALDAAGVVDDSGEDFLAGARLSGEEDVDFRVGEPERDLQELRHPGRPEDRPRPGPPASVRGHRFCSSSSVSVVGRAVDGGLHEIAEALQRGDLVEAFDVAHVDDDASIGAAERERERAVGRRFGDGGRLRLELAVRFVLDADAGRERRALEDRADTVREQVDRVAGAEDRGHVGEDERGVGEVALASIDGHAAADAGRDLWSRPW